MPQRNPMPKHLIFAECLYYIIYTLFIAIFNILFIIIQVVGGDYVSMYTERRRDNNILSGLGTLCA